MNWNEDELEKFIRSNRDKFNENQPAPDHQQLFLNKLLRKFREIISIVPYLAKVGVATLIIFTLSFFIWKMYISPPLTHVSLKYWKVERGYRYRINRNTRLVYSYATTRQDSARLESRISKYDNSYNLLKKQLKKDPSPDNIVKMLGLYKEEVLSLESEVQNYRTANPNK
jgi:hypothetical protein